MDVTEMPVARAEVGSGSTASLGTERLSLFVLVGAIVLGALLRLAYLGRLSLWLDEAFSVNTAALPGWSEFWQIVSVDVNFNMIAYYMLLRLWLVAGDGDVWVRALSVVPAVATLVPLYVLGRRLLGARVALLAAALLAVNAFHIRYAQEARGYTLVVLMITLSSLAFVRLVEDKSPRAWVLYILTSSLAVYTQLFSILVLIAHWLSLALLPRRNVPWRQMLWGALLLAFLFVPIGVWLLRGIEGSITWIERPSLYDLARFFYTASGGAAAIVEAGREHPLGRVARRLLLLAYLLPAAVGAVRVALKHRWQPTRERWHFGFVVLWLVVPIGVAFAVSLEQPIFEPRYLLVTLPPLCLLAAAGLSLIRPRWLFAAAVVVVLGLGLYGTRTYYTFAVKDDWRGATGYILSKATPRDGIIFHAHFTSWGFDYYTRRQGQQGPRRLRSEELAPGADLPERVWLVLAYDWGKREETARAIEASLRRVYSLSERREFEGIGPHPIRVSLYAGRPSP